MGNHTLREIEQACLNKDPIKLSAVFKHLEKATGGELSAYLEPVCKTPIYPVANEIFSLVDRSGLSEESLKNNKEFFTEICRREPEAALNLFQSGKFQHNLFLAEIAGELELEEAVPFLHDYLNEFFAPGELSVVLEALGKIGDEGSISRLKMFLDLNQPALAHVALKAIGGCGGEEALEIVLDIIGKNRDLDMVALDILPHLGYAKGILTLAGFLRSGDVDLRNKAIDKLAGAGCLSIPFLHDLLSDPNPDTRIVASNTLGFIKSKESVKPLLHAAKDENPNVRYAAYEALGRIGKKSSIMHLPGGVLDEEPQVRVAAMTAIEENIEDQFTVRGIRNFFEMRQENIEIAAQATVVSNAKKVFLYLSDNELFREICYKFFYRLRNREDRDEIKGFLKTNNRGDLVRELDSYGSVEEEGRGFRVLVVDDSKIMHKIIKSALAPANHSVASAYNGYEALDLIKKDPFDIVLTDMNMPEMNGIELIKNIRADKRFDSIPVIMITTQSGNLDKNLAISEGANYFLTKPFKNEKLLELVDDYLHGRDVSI